MISAHPHQMGSRCAVLLFVAGVAIAWVTSCSATGDAPRCQAESPVKHQRDPALASSSANVSPGPPTQTPDTTPSRVDCSRPHRPDEPCPRVPGMALSPLDKAIADDFPSKPWSKNVPERACKKDDECGDGFCDRDRCAPIWTWTERYGQRCDASHGCPGLCLDGRCRSCMSDAECVQATGSSAGMCTGPGAAPPGRRCALLGLHEPSKPRK